MPAAMMVIIPVVLLNWSTKLATWQVSVNSSLGFLVDVGIFAGGDDVHAAPGAHVAHGAEGEEDFDAGAIFAKHGRLRLGFDDADDHEACLGDDEGFADGVLGQAEFFLGLGVDDADGACVLVVDQTEFTAENHGAIFDFVPGRLDALDLRIGLDMAGVGDGLISVEAVHAGEVGDGGAVLNEALKMLGAELNALPGDVGPACAAPVGEDEDFVGAEGFEFAEHVGAQSRQHRDDGGDRGDADDDADGGEGGADFVGPDLAQSEHDALINQERQCRGQAEQRPHACTASFSTGRSDCTHPSFMRMMRLTGGGLSARSTASMPGCVSSSGS